MSRYDTITNPVTNRRVSIHGKTGRSVIKNYLNFYNATGGAAETVTEKAAAKAKARAAAKGKGKGKAKAGEEVDVSCGKHVDVGDCNSSGCSWQTKKAYVNKKGEHVKGYGHCVKDRGAKETAEQRQLALAKKRIARRMTLLRDEVKRISKDKGAVEQSKFAKAVDGAKVVATIKNDAYAKEHGSKVGATASRAARAEARTVGSARRVSREAREARQREMVAQYAHTDPEGLLGRDKYTTGRLRGKTKPRRYSPCRGQKEAAARDECNKVNPNCVRVPRSGAFKSGRTANCAWGPRSRK